MFVLHFAIIFSCIAWLMHETREDELKSSRKHRSEKTGFCQNRKHAAPAAVGQLVSPGSSDQKASENLTFRKNTPS